MQSENLEATLNASVQVTEDDFISNTAKKAKR